MSKIKFIFIDDDPDMLALMKTKIGDDFEIITQNNGSNVLKLVEDNNCHIIITDLNMPNIDGFAVLEEVKASDPAATIMALTGEKKFVELFSSISKGFDDYFRKPFDFKELEEVIRFHQKKLNRWMSKD